MKNLIKKSVYIFIFLIIINISSLSNASAAISTSTLVDYVNNSRLQSGMNSLSINSKLEQAALAKAQDMFNNQYFAHTSPTGKTPWDFINSAGYDYVYAGENLAIGYSENTELHNAWMDSPTHRDNILNPNFREIGIASVSGIYEGSQTIIVVQEFGSTEYFQPVTEQASNSPAQLIDINQSKITPSKIFSGDSIELKAVLTADAKDVYFTIGDEKIILNKINDKMYSKKIAFTKVGTWKVTLTAIDSAGKIDSKSLGNLTVVSKILSGTTNNQNPINNNSKLMIGIGMGVLLISVAIYLFIYRNKRYNKFSFRFN